MVSFWNKIATTLYFKVAFTGAFYWKAIVFSILTAKCNHIWYSYNGELY